MGVTRKYYTDEFKQEAVKLAESVGIAQAARDLGVCSSNIIRWRSGSLKAPLGKGSSPDFTDDKDKEILKLKKELKYVYEVNEVLKKSLGIFVPNPRKNIL